MQDDVSKKNSMGYVTMHGFRGNLLIRLSRNGGRPTHSILSSFLFIIEH